MSDPSKRPKPVRVRRLSFLRRSREPVLAGTRDVDLPGHDGADGGGSADVREPRHPEPLGPPSGAGGLPIRATDDDRPA